MVTESTYAYWVRRVDPAMGALKAIGAWAQPHPWITLFVPTSRTAELIRPLVAELTPADLGAGLATFLLSGPGSGPPKARYDPDGVLSPGQAIFRGRGYGESGTR